PALTQLMAPILAFTAEEIWQTIPDQQRGAGSVHLTTFPKPESKRQNPDLEKRWEQLLAVRAQVQAALEIQRREKLIGAPLEAKVVVEANAEIINSSSTMSGTCPASSSYRRLN